MTGRALSAELAAALAADHIESFILLEADLSSGTIYISGLPFDVTYGGHTYLTLHGLLSMESVVETDTEQAGIAFQLAGVRPSDIALVLAEDVEGRPCTVKLVVVDNGTLRVDEKAWQGQLDVLTHEGGPQAVVRVTAEHALIAWDEPAGLTYSHADQQRLHPGDMFFEYTASMAEATVVWPSKATLQAEAGG